MSPSKQAGGYRGIRPSNGWCRKAGKDQWPRPTVNAWQASGQDQATSQQQPLDRRCCVKAGRAEEGRKNGQKKPAGKQSTATTAAIRHAIDRGQVWREPTNGKQSCRNREERYP